MACLLLSIVANIYNPFSVKALGSTRDFGEMFAVESFDRKQATFSVATIFIKLGADYADFTNKVSIRVCPCNPRLQG